MHIVTHKSTWRASKFEISNKTRLQHKQWALKWIHVIHFILRQIAFGLHSEESTSTEIDYKQEEKEKNANNPKFLESQTLRRYFCQQTLKRFGWGFLALLSSDHQAHLKCKIYLNQKNKITKFSQHHSSYGYKIFWAKKTWTSSV